jgi:hypothetical protein
MDEISNNDQNKQTNKQAPEIEAEPEL